MEESRISIRTLMKDDFATIARAFQDQGWQKPASQYERYYQEQLNGERVVLIAEYSNQFAGYVTIKWESTYPPFSEKEIPEIVDLNVLINDQNKGIATVLMDEAEKIVKEKSAVIGIGFGLTGDYGAAQRLYVKRGYIPDGLGISQSGKILKRGDQVQVDDDLALYLTKSLHNV
ncbi:GNAT family N-acetyltransferase [Lederbergia sp. NSJ-179]|uniref:GNAT family N-acetyltransferase n=1 Tax=Lederbergia sp. NSJ-179 TaxID=2931402 RepID=UPI001FD43750|nr:GNAT family N-acetyltransferase [Lederbergia sp. NSJ-179]MCJ7840095.1 GNAT family N-acetyltransferase [Lederbergia sp. NSJ-179]